MLLVTRVMRFLRRFGLQLSLEPLLLLSLLLSSSIFAAGKAGREYRWETDSRSQSEFLTEILKKPEMGRENLFHWPAIISTTVSNLVHMSEVKAQQYGFTKSIMINKEGFRTEYYSKLAKEGRPTVVFVGGLGSNLEMSAFYYYAVPLVVNQGWGVVMVENGTSPEWIIRNDTLFFSGYQAGWNLYLFLQQLKETYSEKISELHVVGISLGGNDAAHASYFDSLLHTNVVDGSFMAWSSPAHRLEGMKQMRTKPGFGNMLARHILKPIYDQAMPVFQKYTNKDFQWFMGGAHFQDVLKELFAPPAYHYFIEHSHHFERGHLPDKKNPLGHVEEILNVEQYSKLFTLPPFWTQMKKPMLWIHSEDDPVVSPAVTVDYIKTQKQKSYVSSYLMPDGGHIGYVLSRGRPWVESFIVNYVKYWGKLPKAEYDQWKAVELCKVERSPKYPFLRKNVCRVTDAKW
ncbi:MAG: hypothetical protein KA436_03030 [Oligoflexales bacterium]|nr:hypothetical protein [Oligoflexales bacterium]